MFDHTRRCADGSMPFNDVAIESELICPFSCAVFVARSMFDTFGSVANACSASGFCARYGEVFAISLTRVAIVCW
jgi:hypothetical protein